MKTVFERFRWSQKLNSLGIDNELQIAFGLSLLLHICIGLLLWLGPGLWSTSLSVPKGVTVGIVNLPGATGKAAKAGAQSGRANTAKQGAKVPAERPEKSRESQKPKPSQAEKPPKQAREDVTAKKADVSLKPKKAKVQPVAEKKKERSPGAKPEKKEENKEREVPASNTPQRTLDSLLDEKKTANSSNNDSGSSALGGLNELLSKSKKGSGAGGGQGDGTGGGTSGSGFGGVAGNLYHAALHRRIKSFWQVPAGIETRNLASKFELKIARDGRLMVAKLVQSSGSDLFDASASAALRSASPFDPVPQSLGAPYRVTITLVPDQG
jgi:protein TonB